MKGGFCEKIYQNNNLVNDSNVDYAFDIVSNHY